MRKFQIDNTEGRRYSHMLSDPVISVPGANGQESDVMHGDSIMATVQVTGDTDGGEIENAYTVVAITFGRAGLFISMDVDGIDRFMEGLQRCKDTLQDIKVGDSIETIPGFENREEVFSDEDEDEE